MKIELGESLVYSWMRHVKGCQIVQTNWKMSPVWSLKNMDVLTGCYKLIQQKWPEIFDGEKKPGLETFLKQAEVDVFGAGVDADGNTYYCAADVAFHEGGLLYDSGGKNDNLSRVTKKLIRTALGLSACVGTDTADVMFMAPKVQPKDVELLLRRVEEVQEFMDSFGFKFRFQLLYNDVFATQVYNPIEAMIEDGTVKDSGELFVRALQLRKLCCMTKPVPVATVDSISDGNSTISGAGDFKVKIGQYAKGIFIDLLVSGKLTDEQIKSLRSKLYCSKHMGISLPILVDMRYDKYDAIRYYKDVVMGHYLICSQWVEKLGHRRKLDNWLRENNLN